MDKYQVLRHYFGHDSFRPGQEAMIDALIAGRDALGVMPTGAGKSMCYQIPALVREGVTLVISPLISLMKDQVAALRNAGVPAAYLNSSLTPSQLELATERACQGMYRIIYVAPERLEAPSFQRFAMHAKIALIAVDEAHCVSQWGQDFRPNYLRIAAFIASLPVRPPVGAFTATATQRVRQDVIRLLALNNPAETVTGFDRPNLYFEVTRPDSRDAALLGILKMRRDQYGIVYCATRKTVEKVCDILNHEGILASAYHAGLPDEERQRAQEDFQYDRVNVMVATNAFGMGIDKSNVQYVIHYNMPKSMEAYYQEAGRAGRDGEPAECILLYNGSDIFTAKWMIQHSESNEELTADEQEQIRRQEYARLDAMIAYCTGTGCRRQFILRYFGEQAPDRCGNCSDCCGERYAEAALRPKAKRTRRADVVTTRVPDEPLVMPDIPVSPTDDLFSRLRACRASLAKQLHVPPYIVCDDRTLHDMVRRMPVTPLQLLNVHGMGQVKVTRFGGAFLSVIRAYAEGKPAEAAAAAKPAPRKAPVPKAAPPAAKPWTAEEDETLRRMYLSGQRVADLAVAFGRTTNDVRMRLRKMSLIV